MPIPTKYIMNQRSVESERSNYSWKTWKFTILIKNLKCKNHSFTGYSGFNCDGWLGKLLFSECKTEYHILSKNLKKWNNNHLTMMPARSLFTFCFVSLRTNFPHDWRFWLGWFFIRKSMNECSFLKFVNLGLASLERCIGYNSV